MLKRKPPADNVRRVASIGKNLRGVFTSKTNSIIQYESFAEFVFILRTDRDQTISSYISQPETYQFSDEKGTSHKYTPDFQLTRTDGRIEIHEVTRSERRAAIHNQQREAAADKICQERHWQYFVHTETELEAQTEIANLLLLVAFRPTIYFQQEVVLRLKKLLQPGTHFSLQKVMTLLSQELGVSENVIYTTICHLLWHNQLHTDLNTLLLIDGCVNPAVSIWYCEN